MMFRAGSGISGDDLAILAIESKYRAPEIISFCYWRNGFSEVAFQEYPDGFSASTGR